MKSLQMSYFFVLVILKMIITLSRSECPKDDFTPCTCNPNPLKTPTKGIYQVVCNGVPYADIKNASFVKKSVDQANPIYNLLLIPSYDDLLTVPADLVGKRQLTTFTLKCITIDDYMSMDINALRSSKTTLTSVRIRNCDMRNLNWSFLTGFNQMASLSFTYSSNFQIRFGTLPPLPSLSSLNLKAVDINYRNGTPSFPKLSRGLQEVYLDFDNVMFADAVCVTFINWLVSNSKNTLETLAFERLGISSSARNTVTPLFSSFSKLTYLGMFSTLVPVIIPVGMKFQSKVDAIDFDSGNIVQINPGAFNGNFSDAKVNLFKNVLTRFESRIFMTMLRQMASSTGYLEAYGNPFDCVSDPCHMAWLIRDNRDLLTPVASAQCSNGTWFTDLNPVAFKGCPK